MFINEFLSKYQCSFRRGYSAEHYPSAVSQKWKQAVDNGQTFRELLTDLLEPFDLLSRELLMGKLNAYEFRWLQRDSNPQPLSS